jgi:hypothetical protein
MEIVGTGLFLVGIMVAIVGWIMIAIAAFRVSAGWGVGSLLIPLVALIFVITHWQDTRRGFFTQLGGAALFVIGAVITQSPAKPVEAKPVVAAAAYVPAPQPTAYTYTPTPTPKPKYVPPPEPAQPTIIKVYADRTTRVYYPADCATHPEDAVLIPKTIATMQGYKPEQCK